MIKMDEGSRLVIESMHKEAQELRKEIYELKKVNEYQAQQLILHPVSKRYAWLMPDGRNSDLWDEETHKRNLTEKDIEDAEDSGYKLLEFNVC